MREAEKALVDHDSSVRILKAVLVVKEGCESQVDYFYETDKVSAFEHDVLEGQGMRLCVDLDGVLCAEYPGGLQGEDYVKWMRNAPAHRIPRYKIHSIITAREERHREVTAEWLLRHGVQYDEIHMWDGKGDPLTFKVKVLLAEKPFWYWESQSAIASIVNKEVGVKVLCFEDMNIYG
jgi:uncharacterized HAD superfamily protein